MEGECTHAYAHKQDELAAAQRVARAAESERDRLKAQLDNEKDACALLETDLATLKREMVR
jgi:hypothetical protein